MSDNVNEQNSARGGRVSRGRAAATLVGLGLLAGLVVIGLVLALVQGFDSSRESGTMPRPFSTSSAEGDDPSTEETAADSRQEQMDVFADEPMTPVARSEALPGPLTSRIAGPAYQLPAPADADQLIPVYKRSTEGAIAQLVAIEEAAIRGFDPAAAEQVFDWAAMEGAGSVTDWQPAGLVAIFNRKLGTQGVDGRYQITHAKVKGVTSDKRGAVVCVLGVLEFSAPTGSDQIAFPDCQRMWWDTDADGGPRWRIGPGSKPSFAPTTWPGTEACVRVGWRAVNRDA